MCVAMGLSLATASGAMARPVGPIYMCVPAEAGAAVVSGGATGECKKGYSSVGLPSNPEQQEKFISIIKHVNYKEKGIDGKPTIQISGVDLQVYAGAKEDETTGLGNLVIGNDESPGTQSGSNNLIMGSVEQSFTSFGSILGGSHSVTLGQSETVLGFKNTANGPEDSVTGGKENVAESINSSVSGGIGNRSDGDSSSITGGNSNIASGGDSTVLGGYANEASGNFSTVLGEAGKKATNEFEAAF
jgi:hypothetical protein